MFYNIIILYILSIIIICFLIYYFILFSNNTEEENFKILHYIPEEISYFDLISNLNNQFGTIDIYNLNNLKFNNIKEKKNILKNHKILEITENNNENNDENNDEHNDEHNDENNDENKNLKNKNLKNKNLKKKNNKFLLYGNHNFIIDELPNISHEREIFLGGYNSCVSPFGDIVLLYKYSKGVNNNDINWLNINNEYIKNRDISNTFLYENGLKENDIIKHNSYIILTRYLYDNKPALHVNYITRRTGNERDLLLQTFIGFLNYIKNFIKENKIFYYSIAGRTNLNSAKWQKIVKYIFKNEVHISPGVEKKFISNTSDSNFYYTPDFICVCKNLAPYGVYFYLSEPMFNYTPNKILVCEILTKNNTKKNIKSKNDQTKLIYDNVIYQKQYIKKNLKIDNMESSEVNLKTLDLKKINDYTPLKKKSQTIHFYDC